MFDRAEEFLSQAFAGIARLAKGNYVTNLDIYLRNIGISLGMLLLVWLIEIRYVGWKESGMRRILFKPTRSTVNDFVWFLGHILGASLILSWVASFGIPLLLKWLLIPRFRLDLAAPLPPALRLILFLLLVDFMNYWQHRVMHRVPALWHVHAFHHAATEFNTATVFREHPLDKALKQIFQLVPAILLGVPAADYPIFISVYGIVGYFKHSRVPWRLGWFGNWVVQTPHDHWIHHSRHEEHFDRNFAIVFTFWDKLFGTYYRGPLVNTDVGLDGGDFNRRGVVRDFIAVQFRFLKACFAPRSVPPPQEPEVKRA